MRRNIKIALIIAATIISIIFLTVIIVLYNIHNKVEIETEETGITERVEEDTWDDGEEDDIEEVEQEEIENEEVEWEDIEEEYVREDPFEEYIDKKSIGQYEIRLERVEGINEYDNEKLPEHENGFMVHLKVKNTGEYAEDFKYDLELESDVEGDIWEIPVQYNSEYLAYTLDGMDTNNVFYYILPYAVPAESSKVVLKVKGDGETVEFDVSPDMWVEYSGDYYNLPTHLGDVTLPSEVNK